MLKITQNFFEFPDFRNLKNCSETHFFISFYLGFSQFKKFKKIL
jgi:hypothetical protein